ncbi:Hypothetical Protein FCC1311_080732 [Hondaea fermentalgiana]|uniref:BZIP domain-containing protein n=1 Tax=Hondaea fermentalgiana TaxID=2315210 RepID=A0A2R5GPZ3_9STRA|nr:Hypothetical Protein FCC1311_080732 [Hondaea fermentalgiana]|eukprot:GBG31848.1 Hypothetical Protein FCC1311_080732 [Hondaea fermentalgiana]
MAGRPLRRESSDYFYRRDSESGWLDARALAGLGLGLPLQQQQQQLQQQMTTRAETDKIVADIDASPVPASRARSQGAGTAPTGGGATGAETADCSYNRRKLQNSQAARRFRAKRKEELKRMREEIATLKRENGEAQRLLTEVRKFCHAKDVGLRDFPALHDIDCLLAAWEEEDRNQSDNDASENGMGSGRGVECTGSATNGDAPGVGHASGNNNNSKTFVPPQSMKSSLVLSSSNVPVGASAPTNSPVLAASTGLTAPAHAPSPLQGPSGLAPGQSQALFDLFNLQAGGHDAAAYPMASSLLKQMAGPGSSSITRLESKIAELERRLMERIAELPEKFGGSNDAASNKRQRRAATSS